MKERKDTQQEKVESPTARVTGDVWPKAAIKPPPALARVYIAQRKPYAASHTTARRAHRRRHLKLDFEQVERVHAKHRDRPRADTRKRVVLPTKRNETTLPVVVFGDFVVRTNACVGKKLGCAYGFEFGFCVDMRREGRWCLPR